MDADANDGVQEAVGEKTSIPSFTLHHRIERTVSGQTFLDIDKYFLLRHFLL
jgi:hypothetical protein